MGSYPFGLGAPFLRAIDNLKLDKDEKNNGIKHDNKRNLVKENWQGLNFEPAK